MLAPWGTLTIEPVFHHQINTCLLHENGFSMMVNVTPVLIPNTPNRDLSRAAAQKILLRYKTY